MVAKIPMMAITISNSSRVKPLPFRILIARFLNVVKNKTLTAP
ncbi:MAG: hypothetical protein ACD_75C02001G0002 [uncultured bacterium]|nr:MAG: hypothetical protein ACD_75C02001G0002 [uncultured bacterium]